MLKSNRIARLSLVLLALIGMAMLVGCPSPAPEPEPNGLVPEEAAEEVPEEEAEASAPLAKSELLVELPTEICNTPDAMALLPDGNIVLSVPNFNDLTQPAVLMTITTDNQAEKFYDLPKHPGTGENLGPLGICVAPSGEAPSGEGETDSESTHDGSA